MFGNKGNFFFIPIEDKALNEKGLDFFGTILMGDLTTLFLHNLES